MDEAQEVTRSPISQNQAAPNTPAHEKHSTRYLVVLLVVVLAVILAVAYVLPSPSYKASSVPVARTDIPQGFPQSAPTPTQSDAVGAQRGFQYLVTYGATGFTPSSVSVHAGDVVRFTYTGSQTLELKTSEGAQSPVLRHGQYWQYTFAKAGVVRVQAAGATCTVTVQ